MTNNNIDRLVAENRERIRQIGGRFIEVDSSRDRTLKFGPSAFGVSVDATVYKRTTGSQLIVGHNDDDHGFGRGTFGDDRGEWVEAGSNVSTDVVFTKQGRRAVANALDGEDGAVTTSKAGVGTSDPSTEDESLTGVYSDASTANDKPSPTEVRSVGDHDAASWAGDPVEFGIFDDDGRLLARVVIEGDWSIDTDDGIRLDVTLTFDGDGIGNSVITNDGEVAVADSMETVYESTGPVEFAFGSGTDTFDKSDSSLTSEAFRKPNERTVDRNRINARTHVFEGEPSGGVMPLTLGEMAVFDNDGRMIWATTFQPFTKRADSGVTTESEFRVF